MKEGRASSGGFLYRPVMVGERLVGGERCSSLYRLLSMKEGRASSGGFLYRTVMVGERLVGGERCSSLYRLLKGRIRLNGSSLR